MSEFQEVSVEELEINPFTLINKGWMLITAGDEKKCNTMTASWGGVGELWEHYVSFCFVRDSRGQDVMAACGQLALLEVKNSPLTVLK